jgi:hypothetical protein
MNTNLIQGEDLDLELAIRDEFGEPLQVKNIGEEYPVTLGIKANLLSGYDIQKEYALEPEDEQGEITFHEADHKLILKITRAQSKLFVPGRLRVEVVILFADENFPEGKTVVKRFTLGRIVQSFTKEL